MYFWTQEIETINEDNIVLKDWKIIQITPKNNELFTEEPITWSELQEKWINIVTDEFMTLLDSKEEITPKLVDILFENNLRLVDISQVWDTIFSRITNIKASLYNTIEAKNNETIVNIMWKDNLDNFSTIFWAKENAPDVSVRNIRIKDIFHN